MTAQNVFGDTMNKLKITLGLSLSAMFSALTYAQPLVKEANFEESISGEKVLAINGNEFGNAPNVVLYDDFEKGISGEPIGLDKARVGSWDGKFHGGTATYHEQHDGNLAQRIRDHSQSLTNNNRIANLVRKFPSPQTHAVVAFSVIVPEGTTFAASSKAETFPDRSSWKFTWLVSEQGIGQDDKFDLCMPSHIGNGNFMLAGNNGNLAWMQKGSDWWAWGSYNHITSEVKIDPVAPKTTPVGYFYQTVSPVAVRYEEGTQDPSNFSGTDYQFDRILVPGWWGNGDNNNFDALYDNVYVAVGKNAKARIIVTDNANFNESKTAVTLPAESWTDSRIEILADLLPDRNSYFVHMVDHNGTMSSRGHQVCPRCSSPPQEPRVQ